MGRAADTLGFLIPAIVQSWPSSPVFLEESRFLSQAAAHAIWLGEDRETRAAPMSRALTMIRGEIHIMPTEDFLGFLAPSACMEENSIPTRFIIHGLDPRRPFIRFLGWIVLLLAIPVEPVWAQAGRDDERAEVPDAAPTPGVSNEVVEMLRASGAVGGVILLLSVAAVAMSIESLLTLRRARLAPTGLAEEVQSLISMNEFDQATAACNRRPSFLATVLLAGLREVRIGYPAVEKAMEDVAQAEAARLHRKVEYLALIANLAPMLGLLGTVYGILLAFKQVAETRGPTVAADMAQGVYLALVTTVEGLVVAIPALGVYAFFRGRIEALGTLAVQDAENAFHDFKRHWFRFQNVKPKTRPAGPPPSDESKDTNPENLVE